MSDAEHESSMPWPDVPRLAFGPGGPGDLNADVAWVRGRPREMYGHIEGFRRMAVAAFDYAVESRSSTEIMLFPIAFAWRHYLELALKDIIAAGRELKGEEWWHPSGHKLLDLWVEARAHIIQLGNPNAPEVANVEHNIREFHRIDPGGDGFRYTLDVKLTTANLANAPANVSLRLLHEAMDAVYMFLSAVKSELSSRLDYVAQREAEYARECEADYARSYRPD